MSLVFSAVPRHLPSHRIALCCDRGLMKALHHSRSCRKKEKPFCLLYSDILKSRTSWATCLRCSTMPCRAEFYRANCDLSGTPQRSLVAPLTMQAHQKKFLTALWRYNPQTVAFTKLKCTIQSLVVDQDCVYISKHTHVRLTWERHGLHRPLGRVWSPEMQCVSPIWWPEALCSITNSQLVTVTSVWLGTLMNIVVLSRTREFLIMIFSFLSNSTLEIRLIIFIQGNFVMIFFSFVKSEVCRIKPGSCFPFYSVFQALTIC